MSEKSSKNKYQHNDDGTTLIFVESKNKRFPGKHTIKVNTEDWHSKAYNGKKLKEMRWLINVKPTCASPYAVTQVAHANGGKRKDGKSRRIQLYMHRLVAGATPKGWVIDHINHDGLDNRSENLRQVTKAGNARNSKSQKGSSSRFKGVSLVKKAKTLTWRAHIKHNQKFMHLGQFHGVEGEYEAAHAYNKKAIELWGEEQTLLNELPQEYVLKYNK